MNKLQILVLCLLLGSTTAYSQGTSGTNAKFEYRSLIDLPTAGILERGYVGVGLDALPFGVVITKIEVGVFNNFSFGISYGGGNIIGTGEVDWYELPGVNVRFRPVDETPAFPAIAIGFDSQGKGVYDKAKNRYQIKSPGFFISAAKNFEFFGYLSLHGMINYSMERDDGDKDVNLGIGVEKTIGDQVSFVAEYDFAINDNTGGSLGDGNGYLNMGLRWSVGEGFTVGVDLRNLLDNNKLTSSKADRGIFVEYVTAVF